MSPLEESSLSGENSAGYSEQRSWKSLLLPAQRRSGRRPSQRRKARVVPRDPGRGYLARTRPLLPPFVGMDQSRGVLMAFLAPSFLPLVFAFALNSKSLPPAHPPAGRLREAESWPPRTSLRGTDSSRTGVRQAHSVKSGGRGFFSPLWVGLQLRAGRAPATEAFSEFIPETFPGAP